MSHERFKISVEWENRRESPKDCAERLRRMIAALSKVHPLLAQWFTDAEKKGGLTVAPKPLPTSIDELATIFQEATTRKDAGALWPELGYHVTAWNGIDGPCGVVLKALPGSYGDWRKLPNSSDLEFQPRQPSNTDLIGAEVLRSALLSMMAWDPICGTVSTWDYWDKRFPPPQHWPIFRSGWMTYLSAPYARKVTPPPSAITELVAGGGILMLATNEPFTIDNPKHVAVADAIQACLEPLQSDPRPQRP
jgi:hypothetical protein